MFTELKERLNEVEGSNRGLKLRLAALEKRGEKAEQAGKLPKQQDKAERLARLEAQDHEFVQDMLALSGNDYRKKQEVYEKLQKAGGRYSGN